MSDSHPDWGTPPPSGYVVGGKPATPVGTPIHRPDWGSGGQDEEHVVGMRSGPVRGTIHRPDWGDGDQRQVREYVTKERPFPNVAEEPEEVRDRPDPQSRQTAADDADSTDEQESTVQEVSPEQEKAVAEYASRFMEKGGVSPGVSSVPMDWLKSLNREEAMKEPVAHAYDLRHIDLPDEARPFLTSYANRMAREGASEQEFIAGVELYFHIKSRIADHERETRNQSVTSTRSAEAEEFKHKDAGTRLLRDEWGADFNANVKTITRYLDSLPKEERRLLEQSRNEDGIRFGNDPERLREFLAEALANQEDGMSRGEIEQVMRTNRTRYDRDPAMQSRYRQLLRQGD